MPYRYLEDIATADVAFEAWGETVEEMFEAACDAVMNVMVGDLQTIDEAVVRDLFEESEALDMLLFRLLQELIFYKDAQQLLLRVSQVQIHGRDDHWTVRARAVGELLDPSKHDLVVDVKAVTLHRYRVEKTTRRWEAQVILDI